jgi:CheY-like chemotaxis protein
MPKSVLIVDDDPNVVELIVSIVKMFGVDARVSHNGKDALDALRAAPPDALILDLMMPVMDGFTMLTQLRNDDKHRAMPVIVLSALADQRGMVERLPGIVGSITKGKFSLTELRDLLVKAKVIEAPLTGTGSLAGAPAATAPTPAADAKPAAPPEPAPAPAADTAPSAEKIEPKPANAPASATPEPASAPASEPTTEEAAAPTVPSISRSEVRAAAEAAAAQDKPDITPPANPPGEASTAA